jgi:hypothetical protein
MFKRIALCSLVVAMGSPAAGTQAAHSARVSPEAALSARVSPLTGVAPMDIVVRAFIVPDALNRAVTIVIDSGGYYSSSVAQLDGDRAPRATDVTFRSVPAGSYRITVTLTGAQGERARYLASAELL